MQPSCLYVVGNGFDLWHRIPSSYADFKAYVQGRDRDLLDAVDRYLPADKDWSDLESALADVDVDSIIEDLGHFMGSYGDDDWSDAGHHDFQYEVDKVVQQLSSGLRMRFGEWIRTLMIPTPDTASARLRTINADAAFLTFNYTSTLKALYGVPDTRVLHIHGSADAKAGELILGHAWNPQERRSLNDRHDVADIDSRLVEAHEILDDYFSRTFKPAARLIRENQAFFDHLHSVDTVQVLGHSLSDVDLPYIHALLRVPGIAGARWLVASRSDRDGEAKCARLAAIGVDVRPVSHVSWTDL
ncbi:bacteriophage abortive infection AbiH family protein [Burkholderia cepacia]|uniref:bacteriophage abortive infection AbiH family protein n=1 Tax=Burkholderia cepacia TaxID=292 RepID=UPI002AB61413|nr:bacteriophage abortive infection AbiH family protein [Burkholderia cepacia]